MARRKSDVSDILAKKSGNYCLICFVATDGSSRYCSPACRERAYLRKHGVHVYDCDYCGRRWVGYESIPDEGCGCRESAGRVPVFVHNLVRKTI